MSLSINNYYQKYYNSYDLTSGGTDTSNTDSTTSGTKSITGADSASFSDIAKLFFSFDGSDDASEDSYTLTGNYTPSMMRPAPPALSNEQMKSLLEEIQTNISAADSDTSATEGQDSTLATLQDLLDGYDLSSADSDEIASLFQSVQSVPYSWSYTDMDAADSTEYGQNGGVPPMLQAMGGFPPPFAWGLGDADEDAEDTDNTSISGVQSAGLTSLENGLTTEDIQSLLENLQYSLSLVGNEEGASEDTDNPLATVKALLSKTNFMTANSSELSSLFNNVLQALE